MPTNSPPSEATIGGQGLLSYFSGYTEDAVRRELRRILSSRGLWKGVSFIVHSLARNLAAYVFYTVTRPSFSFREYRLRYYDGLRLFRRVPGTMPLPLRFANVISKLDSERAVEIPIGVEFARAVPAGRLLEVGNVLAYYGTIPPHPTIDLYEVSPGVINEDALTFDSGQRFDSIVSISTIEHIGIDEAKQSPAKSIQVIQHLVDLLDDGGRLLITVPYGYNPSIDAYLREGGFGRFEITAYSPDRRRWIWREVAIPRLSSAPRPVLILTFTKGRP